MLLNAMIRPEVPAIIGMAIMVMPMAGFAGSGWTGGGASVIGSSETGEAAGFAGRRISVVDTPAPVSEGSVSAVGTFDCGRAVRVGYLRCGRGANLPRIHASRSQS
ncbi:hypothetical protein GCM10023223_41510 [Stackebrandtia albiflava]